MSTPTVTEITRRPEPVDHDTFIDELTLTPAAPAAVRVARGGFPSTQR
jgi:hypothetical protein